MFKPSETKNVVAHVIKGGNVPMLLGGVGIGKSSIVKAVADELANGKEVKQGETNPKKESLVLLISDWLFMKRLILTDCHTLMTENKRKLS